MTASVSAQRCRHCNHKADQHNRRDGCMGGTGGALCGCTWAGKLPQIWHPVQQWEEVAHNMWGRVDDRNSYIQRAIQFTGNHEQYGHYMRRVCDEWPISTENAFTDPHLNHWAWLGHAACALAFNCPEDIVRQAWRYLSDEQKLLANKEASRAIAAWRRTYLKDRGVRPHMAAAMLPGFDS